MSIEFLNELEDKISALLTILEGVRNENADLKRDISEKNEKFSTFEAENVELTKELERLKKESEGQEKKLQLTTEKIQGIIARLEMVQ